MVTSIEEMTPEEFQKAREKAIKALQRKPETGTEIQAKKKDTAEYNKRYRELHKSKLTQKRTERKVEKAAQDHRHYIQNKERLLLQQHNYRRANKEERTAWDHQHYVNNRDRILQHCHEYYRENQAARATHDRQYYAEHPEVMRAIEARRHARMLSAEGSFSAEEFRDKCGSYNNVCVCLLRRKSSIRTRSYNTSRKRRK